ncbi:N-acetylmuramoyl-L-alanine amidase [Marinactinospora thermotolerans]|uniref:N-acetylmuramoyl-L-alanine amidase n=1 Tax=Marinactinospora thermotolerans DSM 45154 TaxID=1122192 RepID=A0A1T4N4Z9_9ACTN|nr:N-acetylmuramoyl-L-alanine amidase [Marinactinospora thermotolerans]SJZ74065.1 N-acetylmuramoyl-L-alanine amidase [Marinactinospora thermotolerans DSM 45154]
MRGDISPPSPSPRPAGLAAAAMAVALTTACGTGAGAEDAPAPEVTATLPLPDPAAPSPGEATPAADLPLSGTTVVIDPGHNGGNAEAPDQINALVPSGPGTKACDTVGAETDSGYPEHSFTWDLSLRLRERLEEEGARVVLTRADDEGVGPCVNERAEIGNEAGADAAISIHADGAPAGVRGFHVIAPGVVEGYTDDIATPSMELAEDVRDEFLELSGHPTADYIGDEGIDVRTDLGGLNLSDVPKVFLEAGNMRNATDARNIEDSQWRARAADAVAAGISRYLRGS